MSEFRLAPRMRTAKPKKKTGKKQMENASAGDGVRGRTPSERPQRQDGVAEAPGQSGHADDQWEQPHYRRARLPGGLEEAGDAQRSHRELEGGDSPPVDRIEEGTDGANRQRHHERGDERSSDREDPAHPPLKRIKSSLVGTRSAMLPGALGRSSVLGGDPSNSCTSHSTMTAESRPILKVVVRDWIDHCGPGRRSGRGSFRGDRGPRVLVLHTVSLRSGPGERSRGGHIRTRPWSHARRLVLARRPAPADTTGPRRSPAHAERTG